MTTRIAAWRVAGLVLLSMIASCDDPGPERQRRPNAIDVSPRDSAGVTIVELPVSVFPRAPAGRPAPEPVLRFDGDDDPVFRVTAAFGLGDGRIAVSDRGSQSVRIFGPAGREVRRLGGPGDGPGEFRDVTSAEVLAPDSIWVFDALASRLTIFGPGNEVRTQRLEAAFPSRGAHGILDRFIVLAESPVLSAGSEEGLRRDSVRLALGPVAGGPPLPFGRFAGDEVLVEISARPGATSVMKTEMPFAYRTRHAVVDDRVVTGATERFEFVYRDSEGTIRRIVRGDVTGRLIDAGMRRAYAEAWAADLDMPDDVPNLLRRLEGMPLHQRGPAFRAIVAGGPEAGSPDELWIGLPAAPLDRTAVWIRHDTSGIPVESAVLPADLRVTDVTGENFVGVRSDELGAERIEVYRRPVR